MDTKISIYILSIFLNSISFW